MAKSTEERLADLQKQMDQLKNQEKALKAKQRAENRKKDAHRKIVIGGAVESVLGRPIQEDEVQKLIDFLKEQDRRGGWFAKAMNKEQKPAPKEEPHRGFRRSEPKEIDDDDEEFGTRMGPLPRDFGTRTKHGTASVDSINAEIMTQAEQIDLDPEDLNHHAAPRRNPGEEYTSDDKNWY